MGLRQLCFGVIGWGYWGPKLARNLQALPHVRVMMVADLDEQRLQGLRYQRDIATTTCAEDIFHSSVDGVVIATPAATHYRLAREALLHDKHVLIEKPLTTSVDEAEQLVALARERGLILMVGHTFIYSPAVNMLKQLIEQGEPGKIYTITMERMSLGLFRNDIDVLWDLATHDVSILLYILGKSPVALSVQTYTYVRQRLAEVAYLDLRFGDGLHVHIQNSWLHPCKVRRITLVGERQSVFYDDTDLLAPIKIYDSGVSLDDAGHIVYRVGTVHAPVVDKTEPLFLECEDFARAIRSGQRPMADGERGLEVVRVLEQVQELLARTEEVRSYSG